MKKLTRLTISLSMLLAGLLTLSLPLAAQTSSPPAAPARGGVIGDLLKDIGGAEKKVLALANAMPDAAYAWRPQPGVRSTGEVFQHIASDNYFLPAMLDKPAPKETGITKDYKTAEAFEKRPMTKAAIVAELEKSFAFLRSSMDATTDAQLDTAIDMFGQKSTTRALWISTATHLHEHLGQLIAYSRSNKVTPPWSK
jgi:uncharacterized damage-inducible protein DinB